MQSKEPVILLGAGLAGSLLAVSLAQQGFRVEVFERRSDMRKTDISAGKSINLAWSERGIQALQEVGIAEDIMKLTIPMPGRMIHDLEGKLTFQAYSKDGKTAINSVSRGVLNMRLMDLAEGYEGVNFHFNQRCLGMNFDTGEVELENAESGKITYTKGQVVIGTDGAFSGLRNSLQKTPRFDFSQEYLSAQYKELEIPPGPEGSHLIEKKALHIWPRGNFMLIALPNLDGSFTVTLFMDKSGTEPCFDSLDSPEKVIRFFESWFPDVLPLMPNLVKDFFENPTGDLVTVNCKPWSYDGQAIILGDAAHAMVPFFGQGMNAAFEDCSAFRAAVAAHGNDWKKVFAQVEAERIENSYAITRLAIANYAEMRDHVGNQRWLFRKEVEHLLEKNFPGIYISRYEMVSFSKIPYKTALENGDKNDLILNTLIQGKNKINEIDLEEARRLVKTHFGA